MTTVIGQQEAEILGKKKREKTTILATISKINVDRKVMTD